MLPPEILLDLYLESTASFIETANHRLSFQETQTKGQVKELEFQVSSVLNRLEEAVEKFDSKGTITSLESGRPFPITAKLSEEVVNIIQVRCFTNKTRLSSSFRFYVNLYSF